MQNRYKKIFKEDYLRDVFGGFPEFLYLKPEDYKNLNSLFEKRDKLLENGEQEFDFYGQWMDWGTVNSFQDLKESEGFLIKLIKKKTKPSSKEKTVLAITEKINEIIKKIDSHKNFEVYNSKGNVVATGINKGSKIDISMSTEHLSKETFEDVKNTVFKILNLK